MHAYRIVWEDEAKAREIELFVDYTLTTCGVVQIEAIRPTAITFYNAQSKRPERTLRPHTQTARRLLTESYLATRQSQPSLAEEILAQHQSRDAEYAAQAS